MEGKIVTCNDLKGIWLVTKETKSNSFEGTYVSLQLLLTDHWLKPKEPATYVCSEDLVKELSLPRILEKTSYFHEAMNNILEVITNQYNS